MNTKAYLRRERQSHLPSRETSVPHSTRFALVRRPYETPRQCSTPPPGQNSGARVSLRTCNRAQCSSSTFYRRAVSTDVDRTCFRLRVATWTPAEFAAEYHTSWCGLSTDSESPVIA